MTEQEIMDKLGLKPWSEAPRHRTTRMLVHVLLYVSHVDAAVVRIRGYRQRYTDDLVREARSMAKQCGIDPKRIKAYDGNPDKLRGEQSVVFTDHYRPPHGTT